MSIKQLLANSNNIHEMTYKALWHDYLIKWRIEHQKNRPIGDFHASSLASKDFCLVKAVIEEVLKKNDDSAAPEQLAVFFAGIDIHNKHQNFMKAIGVSKYTEQTYYTKFLDMYATPDAIGSFLNRDIIFEIKSMRSNLFNNLKEVPYNAFCQAQIYMYMVALPSSLVIVENKDDQKLKIFVVEFDLRFAYNLVKHRRTILRCLENKVIPLDKRLCAKPKKKCKYAEYCFNRNIISKIERRMK